MCFSSLVNILFVNLRYYLVYVHLYLKEVLYSLSGASVCAFKICVESKNFIRWFFQSQILSWSVSTYIRSVRGVIQLIRSKCVRFQDFSRANTSPPPQLSLCFHQRELFLSKNKLQLKSLLCLFICFQHQDLSPTLSYDYFEIGTSQITSIKVILSCLAFHLMYCEKKISELLSCFLKI